ncbi:hypothetical protein MKSMC1_57950 [Mycobacterium kansasii]|nr:hypothetical protein MKSMC1_57950 [Mycobacterium kansasii]
MCRINAALVVNADCDATNCGIWASNKLMVILFVSAVTLGRYAAGYRVVS